MAGRMAEEVVLSAEERAFLESQVRRRKAARSLSDRCRMILLCAEGIDSQTKCATGYVRDRHGTEIQPPQP